MKIKDYWGNEPEQYKEYFTKIMGRDKKTGKTVDLIFGDLVNSIPVSGYTVANDLIRIDVDSLASPDNLVCSCNTKTYGFTDIITAVIKKIEELNLYAQTYNLGLPRWYVRWVHKHFGWLL